MLKLKVSSKEKIVEQSCNKMMEKETYAEVFVCHAE